MKKSKKVMWIFILLAAIVLIVEVQLHLIYSKLNMTTEEASTALAESTVLTNFVLHEN